MAVGDLPEIQKIIAIGKTNGEVTYDEINEHLPEKIVNSERIEDVFSLLNQMGIEVTEEYTNYTEENAIPRTKKIATRKKKEPAPKNGGDDPPPGLS